MTNYDKIYVYVGNQSGYTNGNWYYWNGSAWTSGGVYNETALETDKTLTVSNSAADAKVVGDKISELKNDFNDLQETLFPGIIKYWDGNKENDTYYGLTISRINNKVTLNGTATNAVRIRLSGIYERASGKNAADAWSDKVFNDGTKYSITYRLLSGIYTGDTSLYIKDAANTIVLNEVLSTDGGTILLNWTSGECKIVLNTKNGNVYNDAVFEFTITEIGIQSVFEETAQKVNIGMSAYNDFLSRDVLDGLNLTTPDGTIYYQTLSINKYKNVYSINGTNPFTNLRLPLTGTKLGVRTSDATSANSPDWYVGPITEFVLGHSYQINIKIINGSHNASGAYVIFKNGESTSLYSGGDGRIWTCAEIPEAVLFVLKDGDYSNCQFYISIVDLTVKPDLDAVAYGFDNLYIGELINGHLKATGVDVDSSYADYRLSSKDIVALPSESARIIRVKIAKGYLVAIRSGVRSDNLSHNLYWYKDGDTIIIPQGDNYYAISCCVAVGSTSYTTVKITTDDIPKMYLSLYIHRYGKDSDESSEKILNAARLTFNSASSPNTLYSMPVIAHTSDCHGDYSRVKNFLGFCDRIHADLAAITGDLVSYKPYQGLGWFKELVNNADTISAVCVGNHDAYDSTTTDEDVYNLVFDGITEKIGSTTGKTWYYKDVADKSLRIISVNLYEYGGTTRNYTHFSNEQLQWLCDTLVGTPSGYGVVLLYHSPQIDLNSALSSQYDKFFQVTRKYANIYSGVTGSPINDIIDAFIGRTTINNTYIQTGTPSSVSVTADFSAVDSTVEFIAHLTGHFHQDTVCYIPGTTHTQLMLNVICTNAIYGGTAYPYLCDLADLPRNSEDATQNSFNVYVIDRTAGTVKIIRVGSDTTYDMKKRDYMVIPYR